jgi:curved DNA-binding protein CbpA
MQDLYAILGVGRDSSNAAIKAAYRELAKLSHPDLNLGDGAAEGRTKEINYAYTILGAPESRAAYDDALDLAAARARRVAFVNNVAIAAGVAFFAIAAAAAAFTATRMRANTPHLASEQARPAVASRIATIGVPESAAAYSPIAAEETVQPRAASEEPRLATAEQIEAPVQEAEHIALVRVVPRREMRTSRAAAARRAAPAQAAQTAKAEPERREAVPVITAVQQALAAGAIEKAAAEPVRRSVRRERAMARRIARKSAEQTSTFGAEGFNPLRLQQESEPGWTSPRRTTALRRPGADESWGEPADSTR